MQRRQRAAGPAQGSRDLHEAARIRARVHLSTGRQHVRCLAVAELSGGGGLGDVVDPGAAATDVLLGGLDHRQPWDSRQ
jgi:hypothetical protein